MELFMSWKDDFTEVYIYGHDDMRMNHSGYFKVTGFEP